MGSTTDSQTESGDAVENVTRFRERLQQRCHVLGAARFHREVDRGVAEIYAEVGAIVGRGHDVGAMLGQDAGEAMQRAGIIGQMNA